MRAVSKNRVYAKRCGSRHHRFGPSVLRRPANGYLSRRTLSRSSVWAAAFSAPLAMLGRTFCHACSAAALSSKRSSNTKDGQPLFPSHTKQPRTSLALCRSAASGNTGRASVRFGRGGNARMLRLQKKGVALVSCHRLVGRSARANPSIEGTCNGGRQWFALRALAAPSHAPHVKR